MTSLRQRMINDMTVRGLAEYWRRVRPEHRPTPTSKTSDRDAPKAPNGGPYVLDLN